MVRRMKHLREPETSKDPMPGKDKPSLNGSDYLIFGPKMMEVVHLLALGVLRARNRVSADSQAQSIEE